MTEDIEAAPDDTRPADLKHISLLARRLIDAREEVHDAEEYLSKKKLALRELEEKDLPAAMIDVGLSSFQLAGGGSVELKIEHYGTITKEKQKQCFNWLVAHGHGAIIKRTLKATFGKGQAALANVLADYIKATYSKAKFADQEGVHAATLKAFINEQIKAGKFVDGSEEAQLFNMFTRRYAIIHLLGESVEAAPTEDEEF